VIGTSALGMGINIPDVGRICHFGVPSELEQYVQEIGRAGRDGRKRVFRKRRPTKTKTEDLRWVFVITKTKTHYDNEDPSLFSYYENEDHKIFIYTLFS
jgi:superfamily II DNA helicase RecQ